MYFDQVAVNEVNSNGMYAHSYISVYKCLISEDTGQAQLLLLAVRSAPGVFCIAQNMEVLD